MMLRILLLAALVLGMAAQAASACQMATIPELVERFRPDPVERNITRELVPIPLEDIISQADVIVDGEVSALKVYLSSDKCYLLTDYLIIPRDWIAGGAARASVPGVSHPFVVTIVGGTTLIDGVRVTVRDEQLPYLEAGNRMILFLKKSEADKDKFELVGSVSGAFEVTRDEKIRPLLRGAGVDYTMSIPPDRAAFVAHVKRVHGVRKH